MLNLLSPGCEHPDQEVPSHEPCRKFGHLVNACHAMRPLVQTPKEAAAQTLIADQSVSVTFCPSYILYVCNLTQILN